MSKSVSRFFFRVLLLLTLPLFLAGNASSAEKDADFQVRGGLSNSFNLFDKLEYQQIAFFGGEVLGEPKSYFNAFGGTMRERFKGSNIGPTRFPFSGGSWYGAFRVARAEPVYGATIHNACVALVDFASEDVRIPGMTEEQAVDNWEGMVRGFRSFRSTLDVVFVYTLAPEMLPDFKAGRNPAIIQWAEQVAAHYDIPSLNLARCAAEKIIAGDISEQDFFADGSVPSPKGAAIYADCCTRFIDACLAARSPEKNMVARKMPEPLSPNNLGLARMVAYDWATYPKEAKVGCTSPNPYFRHVLVLDKPGETVSLTFTGSGIGLLDLVDASAVDANLYEYSLDGSNWKPFTDKPVAVKGPTATPPPTPGAFPPSIPQPPLSESTVRIFRIAEKLDATAEHTLQLRLANRADNTLALSRPAMIGTFLVVGTVKSPYDGMSVLEKIDAIYAAMPPIQYQPPKNRWSRIPKTMEKLRNGETLKIVMLGDSIMGDTGSSQYEKLLEREYPKCKVQRIMSLRGSTGCWWYKDDNRVESYVLRHEPDLLMIGGISQREDVDAIRSVIRQVREKQNPEIMLITPVFGSENGQYIKNWTLEIDAEKYAYRANLKKLAEEEQCEFLDLTGVTWEYMMRSGKCYGWFRRDVVHANDRGYQVIGRHLVRYLTEDRE